MTKEVKCVGYGKKGMNTVFIPESIAREKMCPACEEGERRINVVHHSCKSEVVMTLGLTLGEGSGRTR